MTVNFNSAVSAYQNAARSVSGALGGETVSGSEETSNAGQEFAGLVKNSLQEAVGISKNADEMTIKGITGEAEVSDVVMAVNNAETALSTVMAVRDKVVNAYQEILKMPI